MQCTIIGRGLFILPLVNFAPPNVVALQIRYKHWNQKFRKERAKKVMKVNLPDFEAERREAKLSLEELKAKMKEKKFPPFRPWAEKELHMSCCGAIMDPYVPPEGDGKISIVSTPGMKQTYDVIGKKGKSYLALRKIRNLDYEFDVPTLAEKAKDIYVEAQMALANKNEDKLHDLVTERAYPEMMENVGKNIIKWKFMQTLDAPRVVHIRCQEMMQKDNMFAQATVRLFSQQTLAVYDRFGRLMYGSENDLKDVLEYIVLEKHITCPLGSWRIHGKIWPEWLPPMQPIIKTLFLPNIDAQFPKQTATSIDVSKPNPQSNLT